MPMTQLPATVALAHREHGTCLPCHTTAEQEPVFVSFELLRSMALLDTDCGDYFQANPDVADALIEAGWATRTPKTSALDLTATRMFHEDIAPQLPAAQ